MKAPVKHDLLCILIAALMISANTKSTTARYTYDDANFYLDRTKLESNLRITAPNFANFSPIQALNNLSETLPRIYRPRMLNRKSKNIIENFIDRVGFQNNDKMKTNYRNSINVKEITQKPLQNLKKKNLIKDIRPKVKFKEEHSKSLVRKSNIQNTNSKSTPTPSKKNSSNTLSSLSYIKNKNKLLDVKPVQNLQINKGLMDKHTNYTKLRIRPLSKFNGQEINPVISTHSLYFPISNSGSTTTTTTTTDSSENNVQNEYQIYPQIYTYSNQANDDSAFIDSSTKQPFKSPLSQVVFQSIPPNNVGNKDTLETNCPTFTISSNVFGPQRQECSDLNVVVNSNYQQNAISDAQSIDSNALADVGQPLGSSGPIQSAAPVADYPAAPDAAPAAAPVESAAPSGGSQGGGIPQLPQLPGLPELGFPDLKGLFDFLGQLWRIVSSLGGFLANPYLYGVPAVFSFAVGFLKVLGTFKIFVVLPALILFGYANRDKPPEIAYYKHIHKPIHHNNGIFWNHNTKSWSNIGDYIHKSKLSHAKSE